MNIYLVVHILFLTLEVSVSGEDLLQGVTCDFDDSVGYVVPDPHRCDRYLDCDPVQGGQVRLCPPGQGVSLVSGRCEVLEDCGDRRPPPTAGRRPQPAEGTTHRLGIFSRKNPRQRQDTSVLGRTSSRRGPSERTKVRPSGPFQRTRSSPRTVPRAQQVVSLSPRVSISDISGDSEDTEILSNFQDQAPEEGKHEQAAEVTSRSQSNDLESLQCAATPLGYVVPDPDQCDRYARCSSSGKKEIVLCPDGLVLDSEHQQCDLPVKVDCSQRPLLQVSCSDFVDCRGGEQFLKSCGAGAVFDAVLGCVHPDQTNREGCSAADRYEVQCPKVVGLRQRFGDHDRVPHPGGDCSLFYACLRNGQPRLLGCEKPTVFNAVTGLCEDQEKVEGCEETYVIEEEEEEDGKRREKGLAEKDRRKIADEVKKQLLKDLGFLNN